MKFLFNIFLCAFLFVSQAQASDLLNSNLAKEAVGEMSLSQKCLAFESFQKATEPTSPLGSNSLLRGVVDSFANDISFDLELDAIAFQELSALEGIALENESLATISYRGGELYLNDTLLREDNLLSFENYLKKLCQN